MGGRPVFTGPPRRLAKIIFKSGLLDILAEQLAATDSTLNSMSGAGVPRLRLSIGTPLRPSGSRCSRQRANLRRERDAECLPVVADRGFVHAGRSLFVRLPNTASPLATSLLVIASRGPLEVAGWLHGRTRPQSGMADQLRPRRGCELTL
jgi:hypothetical protein